MQLERGTHIAAFDGNTLIGFAGGLPVDATKAELKEKALRQMIGGGADTDKKEPTPTPEAQSKKLANDAAAIGKGGEIDYDENGNPTKVKVGNAPKNDAFGNTIDESGAVRMPAQISGAGGGAAMHNNPAIDFYRNQGYDIIDNGNGKVTAVPSGVSGNDSESVNFPSIYISLEEYAVGGTIQGTIPFLDFIQLLRAVESEFTPAQAKDKKFMITQFRKCYYDTNNWDKMIDGAKNISCAVSQVNKQLLKAKPIVILPDNVLMDIGHLFTGADAGNYPSEFRPGYNPILSVDSNIDSATWLGDLGSVLSYLYQHPSYSAVDWQTAITTNSGRADLIGDLDGAILARMFTAIISANNGYVSDMLENFYTNNLYSTSNRCRLFAQSVGLQWNSTKHDFTNRKAWIEIYSPQVSNFARMFLVMSTTGASAISNSPFLSVTAGRHIVTAFVNALQNRLL